MYGMQWGKLPRSMVRHAPGLAPKKMGANEDGWVGALVPCRPMPTSVLNQVLQVVVIETRWPAGREHSYHEGGLRMREREIS